jgi:hypothetical protein
MSPGSEAQSKFAICNLQLLICNESSQKRDASFHFEHWNGLTEDNPSGHLHGIALREISVLILLALLTTKKARSISEQELKDLYPRYKNDLLTLHSRSMILRDNGNYRLFSPVFAEWIEIELTDISQKGERSVEGWLAQYEKSFLEKGLEKVEAPFKKVNPKYWDLLRKTLLLVRNPQSIVELLEKLGHPF